MPPVHPPPSLRLQTARRRVMRIRAVVYFVTQRNRAAVARGLPVRGYFGSQP